MFDSELVFCGVPLVSSHKHIEVSTLKAAAPLSSTEHLSAFNLIVFILWPTMFPTTLFLAAAGSQKKL